MATTLRELIAKLVFRADPSKIQDFDARLDELKAKLKGADVQTKDLTATLAKSGESFLGLRVALQEVNGALDPAQIEAYSAAFKASEGRAAEVRKAIERLRLVDPTNKELPELEKQLNQVEKESKETARALEQVGVSFKKAQPPAAPAAAGGAGGGFAGLTKFIGGLTAAAAAYKAVDWGRQLTSDARAVGDLAARLAIGTDELQTWTAFVEEVGASSEDLSGSVKTLTNNIQAAASEADGAAAKAFKKLGLSTQGWNKDLPATMDVLLAAGGALSELESDTERLAAAQQLLGESGLKLLPAFEGGADAAREQLEELRDLAVVYDRDFIAASTAAHNEMALFERQLKGVGAEVVLSVLPALRDFVRWLTPVVKGVRDAVRNSNILTTALTAAGAVGVVKLVNNFGKLVSVLKVGARAVLRFVLPLLILDDVISFLKGEGSVIGDVIDSMFGMGSAQLVAEGLRDSWQALVGIGKMLWGLFKGDAAAVEEGEMLILKFGGFVTEVFDSIGEGIKGWASDVWQHISLLWSAIAQYLQSKLHEAVEGAKSFLGDLPLIGGLFKGDEGAAPAKMAQNAQNGLALGGSPAVDQRKNSTVTVNDHSSVTTNLNGVDAQNVGAALRQSERNISAELKRNKAQVLRQTVGAAGA